jgi:hypothetical protein
MIWISSSRSTEAFKQSVADLVIIFDGRLHRSSQANRKLAQVQTLSGKTRATGATLAPRLTEPLLLEKTGFQVTLIDRIWVITEALARPLCWTREDCQLYIYIVARLEVLRIQLEDAKALLFPSTLSQAPVKQAILRIGIGAMFKALPAES